ncbi:SprB repeat-containing protein [Flavobacterium branchiicola]|uniref:SprB repeat-containing protein n=1 Tax=Flavobacterium branchiicola TaxID=1114875 RepID=A0ABV9P9U0_9FLAO|nr:SprB repeat-containing protein [Flavobacterium branchiicola]MBS7253182.1 SprB repeat-containing protein [Flavobacterium branchiicola]
MIKTLFLLLFITLSVKGIAQEPTYSIKVSFTGRFFCEYNSFNWNLSSGSDLIAYHSDINDTQDKNFTNVKNYSSFNFSLEASTSVEPCASAIEECLRNTTISASATDLIKFSSLRLGGCDFMVGISEFTPNVSIKNLDSTNPTTICAGFQLGLAAFPYGFPNEAYHWQFSLDNITWNDVPDQIVGIPTNNTPTTNFTIQQILGANHKDYLNKNIYFRLGYYQDRAFTTPLVLTYLPCAPVAVKTEYKAPSCNGDNIQKIDVYFEEQLKQNETLSLIYLKNTDPTKTTPLFANTAPITSLVYDNISGLYKYSFTSLGKLEEANEYIVEYQASMNSVPSGTLKALDTFTYTDPKKVEFKISDQILPSCFGGNDGTIEIEVKGGTKDYKFYVDGTLSTAIYNAVNDKYYINGCKAKTYDIKVTDKFDCIDKTADE